MTASAPHPTGYELTQLWHSVPELLPDTSPLVVPLRGRLYLRTPQGSIGFNYDIAGRMASDPLPGLKRQHFCVTSCSASL